MGSLLKGGGASMKQMIFLKCLIGLTISLDGWVSRYLRWRWRGGGVQAPSHQLKCTELIIKPLSLDDWAWPRLISILVSPFIETHDWEPFVRNIALCWLWRWSAGVGFIFLISVLICVNVGDVILNLF